VGVALFSLLIKLSCELRDFVEGKSNDEQGYNEQEALFGDSMNAAEHLCFYQAKACFYYFSHVFSFKNLIHGSSFRLLLVLRCTLAWMSSASNKSSSLK
jgi:hypothetical protein